MATFISFERDNTQPVWLYWVVIKIGDTPVGHICKNLNVDKKFTLAIYNPQIGNERITYHSTYQFGSVESCKEMFLLNNIGSMLLVR